MADDLIYCPSCRHKLQLPAELYGQTVECPQCHSRFVAPMPQAAPPPVLHPIAPPEPAMNAGPTYEEELEARTWRAGARLRVPAILLLISAGLATLLGVVGALSADKAVQDFQQQAQDPNLPPQFRDFFQKVADGMNPQTVRTSNLIMAGLNVIVLIGAVQMLRLQSYWTAFLGAILALNPINCPCCLMQLPIGLWALILLLNGDVRRAFR
jgi:hypothetical protein